MSFGQDNRQAGAATSEVRLRLTSFSPTRRPSFWVTTFMLAAAAVLSALLIFFSAGGLVAHAGLPSEAVIFLVLGIALAVYLAFFGAHFFAPFRHKYTLELSDQDVRLKVVDNHSHRRLVARMPWSQVDYVEYFTPSDSSTLVFHGKNGHIIEVPIWDMTRDAGPVLSFLSSKHISVVREP